MASGYQLFKARTKSHNGVVIQAEVMPLIVVHIMKI